MIIKTIGEVFNGFSAIGTYKEKLNIFDSKGKNITKCKVVFIDDLEMLLDDLTYSKKPIADLRKELGI